MQPLRACLPGGGLHHHAAAARCEAQAGLGQPPEQPDARAGGGRMSVPVNIAVNAERLWASIMETAQIGATPKGGIKRLTLTDLDRQVREWFRAACEAAGCTVTVDEMGNM